MTAEATITATGIVGNYQPSGFFVIRTPLLPVEAFDEWSRCADGADSNGRADQLRRSLANLLEAPHIAEAIRVASPALADILQGWETEQPSRRRERLERTLVQYFARMCDRCTPFGLFAGVSVGRIGALTRLRLAGRPHYRRRSVLDSDQVAELVVNLLKRDEVQKAARYGINATLATVRGTWRYVMTHEHRGHVRHEIASLEENEALALVLECAAGGATREEARAALTPLVSGDHKEAEADKFVDDLIAAQILQPELIPPIVGGDALDHILECLDTPHGAPTVATRVRRVRRELTRLDTHGVGAPTEAYSALNRTLTERLQLKGTNQPLQVDLFKEAEDLRLSSDVVAEVLRSAEPLCRLPEPALDDLESIKARFRERYESREVPLAEALDPEVGIGFPGPNLKPRLARSPLLNDLHLRAPSERRGGDVQRWGAASNVLLTRVMDSGGRQNHLDLDDELLDRLAPPQHDHLPAALAVHFDLVARSERAVRRGDYRLLFHGASGPSGARMLGRFCHLDRALLEAVRGHLRDEEALEPDVIHAEIVHSLGGRIGNVVRRPRLRGVELSCGGHPRREGDNRLTVDDLLIRLEGRQFRLRSKKDGRQVRPRLTSAHNYRRSSGVYRFLCALQNDGIREVLKWTWGPLEELAFLPRVVRGRAVYAVARWKVGRDHPVYQVIQAATGRTARVDAARRLVEGLKLPRWVRLSERDNRLLLDLDNPLCLFVLAEHAARSPALTLEETLADDLEGCVEGPEGKYRNEIVMPFVRTRQDPNDDPGDNEKATDVSAIAPSASADHRIFAPGDEWLYFKFYCAHATTDILLREVVAKLVTLHQGQEPDRPWFFVRYADPDNHVRVRFRAAPETQMVLQEQAAVHLRPFVERGSVHRIVMDTYIREVERYGGPHGIELAENWFHADSLAVLRIVELVHLVGDEALRWKATAMGLDRLFIDFGFDLAERQRVVARTLAGFRREFRVDMLVGRQLAKRFRKEKAGLEELVAGRLKGAFIALEGVFRQRSAQTATLVRGFRGRAAAGELACSVDDLLPSLTHMHANRMLPTVPRVQEFVLLDFLNRTYRSLMARQLLDKT